MDPTTEDPNEYLHVNRANWDARVPLHLTGYDLESFRRDPKHLSQVVQFDRPRLPDVGGLRGIHLQCHIGTDTLSLARLGAEMVGLDFSPPAIAAAADFAKEFSAPIRYVESEVYKAVKSLQRAGLPTQYDFVYTGIGALCWLPDIERWAATVASLLRPGGFLFIREGHPMLWALGESRADGAIEVLYDYFEGRGIAFDEQQSYAGEGTIASPRSIRFRSRVPNRLSSGLRLRGYRSPPGEKSRPLTRVDPFGNNAMPGHGYSSLCVLWARQRRYDDGEPVS